jgi:hypothetical protein
MNYLKKVNLFETKLIPCPIHDEADWVFSCDRVFCDPNDFQLPAPAGNNGSVTETNKQIKFKFKQSRHVQSDTCWLLRCVDKDGERSAIGFGRGRRHRRRIRWGRNRDTNWTGGRQRWDTRQSSTRALIFIIWSDNTPKKNHVSIQCNETFNNIIGLLWAISGFDWRRSTNLRKRKLKSAKRRSRRSNGAAWQRIPSWYTLSAMLKSCKQNWIGERLR